MNVVWSSKKQDRDTRNRWIKGSEEIGEGGGNGNSEGSIFLQSSQARVLCVMHAIQPGHIKIQAEALSF